LMMSGVQAGCEEARMVWGEGRSRTCYLLTPPFLHLSLQHQLPPPDWSPPSKPTAAKSQWSPRKIRQADRDLCGSEPQNSARRICCKAAAAAAALSDFRTAQPNEGRRTKETTTIATNERTNERTNDNVGFVLSSSFFYISCLGVLIFFWRFVSSMC
jgi:hypothetical protein